MSEPTSAQKLRLEAVKIVAPVLLGRGYAADHIVGEADVIARFLRSGKTPDVGADPEDDTEG